MAKQKIKHTFIYGGILIALFTIGNYLYPFDFLKSKEKLITTGEWVLYAKSQLGEDSELFKKSEREVVMNFLPNGQILFEEEGEIKSSLAFWEIKGNDLLIESLENQYRQYIVNLTSKELWLSNTKNGVIYMNGFKHANNAEWTDESVDFSRKLKQNR